MATTTWQPATRQQGKGTRARKPVATHPEPALFASGVVATPRRAVRPIWRPAPGVGAWMRLTILVLAVGLVTGACVGATGAAILTVIGQSPH